MAKYEFVNAQEMARNHPKTFEAPDMGELALIEVGDHVKVCCNDERFWCVVTAITGHSLTVTVANDLIMKGNAPLKYGSELTVGFEHIYSIINNPESV